MKEVIRVVLLIQGAEEARLRKPFEELAQALRNELGKDRVRLAYLKFASPSLAEVAEEAANDGVTRLRILPLFLEPGGPLEREIPEQAAVVRGPDAADHHRTVALGGRASKNAHPITCVGSRGSQLLDPPCDA